MSEEDLAKQNHKVSKYINDMDPEVKGRFQGLFAIWSEFDKLNDEEEKEIRELERSYEKKYQEIYTVREALINGKDTKLDQTLIAQFDERAVKMNDEDYKNLEVEPCDVKSIQNSPGVSDFWTRAMINHPIGEQIQEKDRPILGYLTNIQMNLHEKGEGYDLIFTFSPNNYFEGTEIKKTLNCKSKGVVDSTVSTVINWKPGCNPTITKKQKKKKGKKVKVEVKCDSFFNFFSNLSRDDNVDAPDDEEDEAMDIEDKLADDLEQSDQIKEDLVPLALEYYLDVIEGAEEEDEDDSDEEGGKKKDDSDDDKKKKKPKKIVEGAKVGPDGKECKQQ